MKIAIQVEENNMNSEISKVFGRCPYFFVLNTETKEEKFIENPGCKSQGGAGIKAAQEIVDNRIDVLLTDHLGENAIDVLKQLDGLEIYKYIDGGIRENIRAYNDNKLDKINIK